MAPYILPAEHSKLNSHVSICFNMFHVVFSMEVLSLAEAAQQRSLTQRQADGSYLKPFGPAVSYAKAGASVSRGGAVSSVCL